MQVRSFCIQVSFIPKGKDTFRRNHNKDVISQAVFNREFTIGSGKEASIYYKARGIHPLHVKVQLIGNNLHITDLFSASGVYVNGNKIEQGEPFPLRNGECFQLGDSKDLICLEHFKASTNPHGEANEIVEAAKKEAKAIRQNAEKVKTESDELEARTQELLQKAKDEAEQLVNDKKFEMEQSYTEKLQMAANEGLAQSRELLKNAEKEAEELIVSAESKCADLIKKRDEQAKAILEEAEEEAAKVLGSIEEEGDKIRERAREDAEKILAEAKEEKQSLLDENSELSKKMGELRRQENDIKRAIENLLDENKKTEERSEHLLKEEEKFAAKFDEAEQDFIAKKKGLQEQITEIQENRDKVHEQLTQHQSELAETLEKNAETVKNLKLTEEQNKKMLDDLENHQETLRLLKVDIQAAEEDKVRAVEEAEAQRKRTSASITELKQQFERQYQMRKKAEEERFLKIREREEYAGQERRKMLKKHERERLPHQVEFIAGSIWSDLAVELQDAAFCSNLFENGEAIPEGIQKIVHRSVMEEFDLRTQLSARIPIYLDKKVEPTPAPVAPVVPLSPKRPEPIWKSNAFMAFMGAVLMFFIMLGVNRLNTKNEKPQRAISSQKATKPAAAKKK